MFTEKKALLLDMNSTFMFGEDRFGDSEDFSVHYFKIGGTLPQDEINRIVRAAYEYLDVRYPDENLINLATYSMGIFPVQSVYPT